MDFTIYYAILFALVTFCFTFFAFYLWRRAKIIRYRAVILRKEGDRYSFLAKRKINSTQESVSFEGISLPLNRTQPTYINGLEVLYFTDKETVQPLLFHELPALISAHALDLIIGRNIIAQIAYGLKENVWNVQIISMIIGALVAGPICFLIGTYV